MELDLDQLQLALNQMESDLAYQEEVLQKSEKYERLMADGDFKDFLKDFKEGFKIHGEQIQEAMGELTQASPRRQEDLFRIILIHQSKKESVEALTERPAQLVRLSKEAQKLIPELKEKIAKAREELHGQG
jgi:hypothetical protein